MTRTGSRGGAAHAHAVVDSGYSGYYTGVGLIGRHAGANQLKESPP